MQPHFWVAAEARKAVPLGHESCPLGGAPRLRPRLPGHAGREAPRPNMTAPSTANDIIERELDDHLNALEMEIDADVITVRAPILYGLDDAVRDAVESRNPKRSRLAVVLETEGGYVVVAERIAEMLRRQYPRVDYIVPNFAMSAGTVLVMSGDAIYMDYYAILGPIDPQLFRGGGLVPALGYLVQFERLIKKSKQRKLTSAEIAFLVSKFDPAELYLYEQERELSISLLKAWLVKYKFKDWNLTRTRKRRVTPKMRKDRAEEIAKALNNTERWHSHSRGISMEVLDKELNLLIEDFGSKPDLNTKLKAYYRLLVDYMIRRGHTGVVHTRTHYAPFFAPEE